MNAAQQAAFGRLGLDEGNWPQVFKYAAGEEPEEPYNPGADPGGSPSAVPGGASISAAPFDITDVAHIEGKDYWGDDGSEFVVWGLLKDGRWFSVSASCDYTGWG